MKKIILFAATLFALSACQESLEQRALRTLQDYSDKNCPMMLSEQITMDSCAFELSTHTLHYYYTLSGEMDNDSTMDSEAMRQMLVDALKNETSTRIYKEAGYSFQYTYHSQSKRGQVLFDATMTKEDYQ